MSEKEGDEGGGRWGAWEEFIIKARGPGARLRGVDLLYQIK